MTKNELLNIITNHYLDSLDFNGMPSYELSDCEKLHLEGLINEDKIFIISEDDALNIHINALNTFGSKEEQISDIYGDKIFAVYPTPQHLSTILIDEDLPFTKMLKKGAEQLRIIYFSVDVLEIYFDNPQYVIHDFGYRGSIHMKDYDEDDPDIIHSEVIRAFGIAYPRNNENSVDRAIGVLLCDLAKLNYESQCKWRGFMLKDQNEYLMNYGFVNNLIYGNWHTDFWIFDCVLIAIKHINILCESMGIPPMFNHDYSDNTKELIYYRNILIPTSANYYNFISSLEKIIVHNLNYKTFTNTATNVKPIERKNEDGNLKGSITMLKEWLLINYKSKSDKFEEYLNNDVISVFREIRDIRQVPAHEMFDNNHDKSLYTAQNLLMNRVYNALYCLILMLSRHPKNKNIVLPEELQDQEKIMIY